MLRTSAACVCSNKVAVSRLNYMPSDPSSGKGTAALAPESWTRHLVPASGRPARKKDGRSERSTSKLVERYGKQGLKGCGQAESLRSSGPLAGISGYGEEIIANVRGRLRLQGLCCDVKHFEQESERPVSCAHRVKLVPLSRG